MKHLKRIFESVDLMDLNDKDIVYLKELIEDTLIDFKTEVKVGIIKDSHNGFFFTTSVYCEIHPKLEEYRFSTGNPYSSRTIDINDAFDRQLKISKDMSDFTREMKSLCFRLSKIGYLINFYSFNGTKVEIYFIVEDEKIKKEDNIS